MKSRSRGDLRGLNMERLAAARQDKIVSAAQEGSQTAFEELYTTYSPRLYRTILSITKSPEDAEDALQETFLQAHRAIHRFEGRSSIYSWLTRIAINSALLTLRRRRSRREVLFDPCPGAHADKCGFEWKDSAPSPERLCEINQRWDRLVEAIGRLGEPLAGPLRMRVAKGATVKEIGRTLNLTEVTVKVRLHRARLRLSAACGLADRERRKSFRGLLRTSGRPTV